MNRSMAVYLATTLMMATGSGPAREPKEPATATANASSEVLDACALVAASDINAAFAPRSFVIDHSGPKTPKLSAKFAQVSNCTFVSKGASAREMVVVTVMLRRAPSDTPGTTLKAMKEGAMKLGGTPADVAGLGDGAYWINPGGSKRSNRQLNVVKGKRIWLVIGESGSKGSDAEVIANLTKVAQAALGRL